MSTVVRLACTQVSPSDKYPVRELPFPHLAGTTDSQESTKLGRYMELRREGKADASQEGPQIQPEKATIPQKTHRSHTTEGASDPQGTRGQHPDQKRYTTAHIANRHSQASHYIVTKGKRREDPSAAPRGGRVISADRTHKTSQTRRGTRPIHIKHTAEGGDINPFSDRKKTEHTAHKL